MSDIRGRATFDALAVHPWSGPQSPRAAKPVRLGQSMVAQFDWDPDVSDDALPKSCRTKGDLFRAAKW